MPLLLMKPPAHCTAAVLDRQHACGRVQRLPSLPQLLLLLLRRRRALLPADRLCACRGRRRAAHVPSLAAVSRLCMCPCPPADYMHTPLPEDNTTLHDLGFEALPFLDADAVSEVMVYCGGWCGCSGGCSRWVAYCAGWLPSRQARGDCFGMQSVAAASEATAGSGGPPLELSVNAQHNALSSSSGGATAEGSTAEGPAFGLRRQAPPPMPRRLKRVHACASSAAGFAAFFIWLVSPFVTRRKSFHAVVVLKRVRPSARHALQHDVCSDSRLAPGAASAIALWSPRPLPQAVHAVPADAQGPALPSHPPGVPHPPIPIHLYCQPTPPRRCWLSS